MTTPLYKKIQNYILEKIESGSLLADEQIPTELELAQKFNVSRMTANKAIVELSQQGILKRIAGRGTFVAKGKSSSPPMQVVDIADEITSRGNIHRSEILEQKSIKASAYVSKQLELPLDSRVFYCHILHFENDVPILLEKRYINPILVPDFFEQDFFTISPSGFLLANYALIEMEHTIEAIIAKDLIASQLDIADGDPCLYIVRRTWNEKGLISFAKFIAPASRYRLHSRIPVESYVRYGIPTLV